MNIPAPTRTSAAPAFRRRPARGFTLLELIVTIGIVLLLASLLVIALGGVRAVANRAESTSALRQMMTGYTAYMGDHNQTLLPGYLRSDIMSNLGIRVYDSAGALIDDGAGGAHSPDGDGNSYVWRLAPYLSNEWKVMFTDYRSTELESRIQAEISAGLDDDGDGSVDHGRTYGEATAAVHPVLIGAARVPSFGLNSIYVGGDAVHGPVSGDNPWENPLSSIAVSRLSEARNPGRLIVFAPVRYWDPPLFDNPPVSDIDFGHPELRPPTIWLDPNDLDDPDDQLPQWTIANGEIDTSAGDYDNGGGVPIARWGKANEIPLAHLDGSVTTRKIEEIAFDAKAWVPKAVGIQ